MTTSEFDHPAEPEPDPESELEPRPAGAEDRNPQSGGYGPPLSAAHAEAPRRRSIRRWPVLAALGALALAGVLLLASLLTGKWGLSEPQGLLFVIPAGAKASIARPGFDSAIAIPTAIRFGPNEPAVITVRNLDDITHRAGPFLVGPGQTYVQRFPEPGQYPIACAVDPLESIVVTVQG